MNVQLPIWIVLAIVVIAISVTIMASRTRRHSGMSASNIKMRPEHSIREFVAEQFGVKWRVLYGSYLTYSEPYAFCESNPHCPVCDYEMNAEKRGLILKGYYWKCVPCDKYYKVPQKTPYEASEIVKRRVEAEIRTGKLRIE